MANTKKSIPTNLESLGNVRFAVKGVNEVSVRCNAFAAHEQHFSDNQLKVIAFCGPSATVKAAIAMLYSKTPCVVHAHDVPGFSAHYKAVKHRDTKWKVFKTPLGDPRYRLWHALAFEKSDERLLLDCSEDSIWTVLRSDRFTTPLLRAWLPWIRERLLEKHGLRPLNSWGCNPAILIATDKSLDAIVSQGVVSGELSLGRSCLSKVSA